MSKRARYIIASLVSAGGALLAIVQVKDNVVALVQLPEWLFQSFLILGISFLVASLVTYLILKLIEREIWGSVYYTKIAEKGELQQALDFSRAIIDENIIPSLERMIYWYSLNPKMFYMVVEEKRRPHTRRITIIGYFSLLPITQHAYRLLSKNSLKGSEFNETHIARKSEKPYAIYLGAILGKGLKGKQLALMSVMGFLTAYGEKITPHIFTHPLTKDGLRLALKYKFTPVIKNWSKPEEQIYYRNLNKE